VRDNARFVRVGTWFLSSWADFFRGVTKSLSPVTDFLSPVAHFFRGVAQLQSIVAEFVRIITPRNRAVAAIPSQVTHILAPVARIPDVVAR